jgi:hypothetical protein
MPTLYQIPTLYHTPTLYTLLFKYMIKCIKHGKIRIICRITLDQYHPSGLQALWMIRHMIWILPCIILYLSKNVTKEVSQIRKDIFWSHIIICFTFYVVNYDIRTTTFILSLYFRYWELQISNGLTEGEYIMYKHDRLPQQVTQAWSSTATGNTSIIVYCNR